MKIFYDMETPWPTNLPAPEGIDAIEWFKSGEIPFVPSVGMEIDTGDGDLRTVRNVYWSADKPDEVAVFFCEDAARSLEYWQRGGWQSLAIQKLKPRKAKA